MKYILLKDEYDLLISKKNSLNDKYKEQGKRKGEACNQSSETWHDNFDFEDATRCQSLISEKLKEVNTILSNVEIINNTDLCTLPINIITIGKQVSISIDGVEKNIIIGGYNTLVEGRFSYNSPLVKSLLGKKEGTTVSIKTPNGFKKIKILKIFTL